MNDELFNNPFSSLKKNLKRGSTGKKMPQNAGGAGQRQSAPKAWDKSSAKGAGKASSTTKQQDFTSEDEAASAMFLAAVGRAEPYTRRSGGSNDDTGLSMADLLAEQDAQKKIKSDKKNTMGRQESGHDGGNYFESAGAAAPKDDFSSAAARASSATGAKGYGKGAAKRKRSASAPHPEDIPDVKLSDEDAQSFAAAMQGVQPVDAKRGRALVPPRPAAPIRHKSTGRDYLTEFTEGKYEFALEYTEEFFEGHVMGLDPLVVAKLRAGQYSPERHIDLHGMTAEQAYSELLAFFKASYNHGYRILVVVTGRGKNSPGGLSVLRQAMQDWLTKDPLRRVVLAFCTAQPKDGGAGALYVLLRKYKKNQGKVRWDIAPPSF